MAFVPNLQAGILIAATPYCWQLGNPLLLPSTSGQQSQSCHRPCMMPLYELERGAPTRKRLECSRCFCVTNLANPELSTSSTQSPLLLLMRWMRARIPESIGSQHLQQCPGQLLTQVSPDLICTGVPQKQLGVWTGAGRRRGRPEEGEAGSQELQEL